jgi:hypothetical protein
VIAAPDAINQRLRVTGRVRSSSSSRKDEEKNFLPFVGLLLQSEKCRRSVRPRRHPAMFSESTSMNRPHAIAHLLNLRPFGRGEAVAMPEYRLDWSDTID